ncbi:MAG: hypothetical protein M3Z85_07920 [Acidobacteriota bacterium]|nr:hypothetical protein [Acidobacteriota bacterium]
MRRHVPLVLAIVFFAAAFYGWRNLQKERELDKPAVLLSRLPTKDAVVLSVDFAALRRGGILDLLSKSKVPEEPEYQTFVRNSNFDYKRDLDSALVAFAPDGTFFLINGRFDWRKLVEYAKLQGGSCYGDLCRMTGSTATRRISFVPLRQDLMALAVSGDDLAASRLKEPGPRRAIQVPSQPVWLSIPSSALKTGSKLPAGTRLFTSAMAGAEDVTLTLGPQGQSFDARLEASCHSQADAASLAAQLEKVTAMLQGPPGDLRGILSSGAFRQQGQTVFGRWTVRKDFIENLAGGL